MRCLLLHLFTVLERSLAEETIHFSTTLTIRLKVECMQRYGMKYEFGCFLNQDYGDVQSLTELLNAFPAVDNSQILKPKYVVYSMILLVQAMVKSLTMCLASQSLGCGHIRAITTHGLKLFFLLLSSHTGQTLSRTGECLFS